MQDRPPLQPQRFAALPAALADPASARAVVAPLPYDATSSWLTGSREGPAAIIAASAALEWFDEALGYEPCRVGIATLDALEPDVRGPRQQLDAVRLYLEPVLRAGRFPVALGGEHSLTLGALKAALAVLGEPLSVLQIDAHADLRASYQGSPLSHACVMRRVRERCPAVQVGLRSWSAEEDRFIQQQGLRLWTMERIRSTPDWAEQVIADLGPRVYLTVDLDGLDPSICPGVGTPEPGGLLWHEICGLLRAVFDARQVVAADVVECLPLAGQRVTEYLAARLVYRIIGLRFRGR